MTAQQAERSGWDLVAAAQSGNAEAFGELWRRYHPKVQRFVRSKVRDQATAEDLTSETFVRAWQSIGSVNEQGRDVGSWLITVARNKVIDHARATARSRAFVPPEPVAADDTRVVDSVPGPEVIVPEQLGRAGTSARLGDFLDELPRRERECLRLRFAEELSSEEVSRVLACSPSGARTLQYRALTRLRTRLVDDGHASSASFAAACRDVTSIPRPRAAGAMREIA